VESVASEEVSEAELVVERRGSVINVSLIFAICRDFDERASMTYPGRELSSAAKTEQLK
jgi:hypothetical protein